MSMRVDVELSDLIEAIERRKHHRHDHNNFKPRFSFAQQFLMMWFGTMCIWLISGITLISVLGKYAEIILKLTK